MLFPFHRSLHIFAHPVPPPTPHPPAGPLDVPLQVCLSTCDTLGVLIRVAEAPSTKFALASGMRAEKRVAFQGDQALDGESDVFSNDTSS